YAEVVGTILGFLIVHPSVDHPLTFVLEDGRTYRFTAELDTNGEVVSAPFVPEITDTGATLTALNIGFAPYVADDSLVLAGSTVVEGSGPWEPVYYQL